MNLAFWRDISIIWLSLLCFVVLAIPLGISYFAVKGINAAHAKLPPLFHKAQSMSHKVRERSETMSEQVASPIARAQGQAAKVETTLRKLWGGAGSSPAKGDVK